MKDPRWSNFSSWTVNRVARISIASLIVLFVIVLFLYPASLDAFDPPHNEDSKKSGVSSCNIRFIPLAISIMAHPLRIEY
jgi:hypothetical protein